MANLWRTALAVLFLATSTVWAAAPPGITLIGTGRVDGDSLDKSGLSGKICQAGVPDNCVPKAIFGGFGSDLTYTGHDGVFVAAPDRGPFDGLTDVPYLNRFHFLHISTDLKAPFPNIQTLVLDTRPLRNESGQIFVGATGAFDTSSELATLRFDPEGIRVGSNGNFYVSDEYGPYVFEFDPRGQLVRRIALPPKFSIANPNADPNQELLGNPSGRQANRGMEGLAISPNGRTLFGMMQNALLQDNGLTPGTIDRLGLNNRIVRIDLLTGATREYVYVLDAINRGQGVSEILAINDHEFLVVERDNRSNLQTPPQAPTRKTIYKIDLTGATDVSEIDSLPAGALPAGIVPVSKTLFIDLLDPQFELESSIPEKIEGLAWGEQLRDGRQVLYVISDNDLNPSLATQIYAFAIDGSAADLDFQRPALPKPLFPPELVKKALDDQKRQDARNERDDLEALVGTWTAVVKPGDGSPDFPSLLTFGADGTAILSAAGPPIPALGKPGHGAWKRIGDRTFAATFRQLTFTPEFQLDGGLQISMIITLDRPRTGFVARDRVKVLDLTGMEIVTFSGASSARKLEIDVIR